jgi:hypothetical protein
VDQQTRDDLRHRIYCDKIVDANTFDRFVELLEVLEAEFSGRASLRTRNEGGNVLGFEGTSYFTFVEVGSRRRPRTIFAGALETDLSGLKAPAIRVRDRNTLLRTISEEEKFPFERHRTPEWTNIAISPETVTGMLDILRLEVTEFFEATE